MSDGQISQLPVPALVPAFSPGEQSRGCAPDVGQPSDSLQPRPRRQAVGRGILRIAGFFILFAALAFVLDHAINHGLRRIKTSKFGSFNRVISGQVNADIVVSGSSRALCHYDPRVIAGITGHSAYNLGMNASQIDLELAVLKLYLEHNSAPQLVIQNLDLFSFETTKKGALYEPGTYMPYLNDKELYGFIRSVDPNAWKWKYIPLYGYAVEDMRFTWVLGLLGCVGINGPEDYFQGFNPRAATWNRDFEQFKANVHGAVSYAIEPGGVADLESIIKTCLQRGVRVVLVYSPEYCEMQALETNRAEVIGKFQQIAARFSVPFWDYSQSDFSKQRELFNNSQHLNQRGAAVFSADLARRLAELALGPATSVSAAAQEVVPR